MAYRPYIPSELRRKLLTNWRRSSINNNMSKNDETKTYEIPSGINSLLVLDFEAKGRGRSAALSKFYYVGQVLWLVPGGAGWSNARTLGEVQRSWEAFNKSLKHHVVFSDKNAIVNLLLQSTVTANSPLLSQTFSNWEYSSKVLEYRLEIVCSSEYLRNYFIDSGCSSFYY